MDEIGLSLTFAGMVMISGFLTLVEFSLLRLKRTKIKDLVESESDEDWLQFWLKRSERYWLTSLVIGTTARIAAGISLFVLINRLWDLGVLSSIVIPLVLASLLVLVLTELLPRAIGRAYGETCARSVLVPMQVLSIATWLLTYPLMLIIRMLGRLFKVRESLNPVADFEEDIMDILETSDKSTELEEDEKELISSVVEFTDTIVREVMVPRVDIEAFDNKATLQDVYRKISETGHSRIPIYEETIDKIVGVFYAKDLLKFIGADNLDKRPAVDEMHEPIFVPETKNINDLLQEFQKKRMNVAIVVDEYGGTAGLVTIKDLLEEIVGEMQDEDDDEEILFTKMPEGGYIVDARMPIDEIEEELDISIPEGPDYETIGGYIYNILGKIPHKNELLHSDGVTIKIIEVNDRKIHKVMLKTSDDKVEGR